ncbi:MAG: helical backbone metal receptor [Candidatus Obscuribacterales bacterium]|nr:helical backbone metal receptor [Candidatus Obscuribacterales bacterium]
MPLNTKAIILLTYLVFQLYFPPAVQSKNGAKLASLAPSITELVYSINAQSQLIGVSSFCDFPPAAKSKTIVGSFTTCNLERLKRLQPDKVLLVSGQEALASQLQHNHFQTVIFPNHHLPDVATNLLTLGAIAGQENFAKERSQNFQKAIKSLSEINAGKTKTSIFFCVFPQPLISVGKNSYLNDVIEISGGSNIASSMPQDYPHFSMEKLVLSDPEVIVMPYESRNQSFLLTAPWSKLRAIRNKRYFFLPPPSQDTLSRPTLRTLEGLFWLSNKLHPEHSQQLSDWKNKWLGPTSVQDNTLR